MAFVLIIMSGVVIYLMWSKFEHEVKSMQGVATASHRSTRNFRNTVAAAVGLGISTMRRRPLRTVLTAVTVMLLTFTIVFFGSFTAEAGIRKVYAGPGGGARQVEVCLPAASTLSPQTVSTLRTRWSADADSFIRTWDVGSGGAPLPVRIGSRLIGIGGWASVHRHDLALYSALRDALDGDIDAFIRDGGIFLPQTVINEVGAAIGDPVMLLGRSWVLRGSFDPDRLQTIRTLEGAAFVPPDLDRMTEQLVQQHPGDPETRRMQLRQMEIGSFPLVDPATVALLWDGTDARGGASASSLVLLPHSDRAAQQIADELATLLGARVTVDAGGQVHRVLYGQTVSLSGGSKLIVPLLLGGLIVFSTMLSSVSDREREIFTFSAVGLAPAHVAVLFFAEAAMYSVIGGMGGYLLSQVFGKGVEVMAGMGWVEAPAMNYSSLNAMAAILVVMAMVLISTIYPAYRASRSANPGIQRKWHMPEPTAENPDAYHIHFPFTVSEHDMVGLISFLEEYFVAHRDRTVGRFAADAVRVRRESGLFNLSAEVWLQPFDQGVSQDFELYTRPSDIEAIYEVYIDLRRRTGPPTTWRRSNALFVQDIRQQFIFWRTIDEAVQDHYHQVTTERFGTEPESDVHAAANVEHA